MNARSRGFTLLELMIVTVIIAILGMIASIPLRQVRERAMLAATKQVLNQGTRAIMMYEAQYGRLPSSITQLDSVGWRESGGVVICRFTLNSAGATPFIRLDARHRGMKVGVQTRYPTWSSTGRYREMAMPTCNNVRGGTS